MDGIKLRPQLGIFDAISTGIAAILGAGIFAVIAPAAGIAGPALLISLVIVAFVAFCNALSLHSVSCGISALRGHLRIRTPYAGTMARISCRLDVFGSKHRGAWCKCLGLCGYLHGVWRIIPARTAAVLAALVMTIFNAGGIKRSVRVTDIVVILSVMSLLAFVLIGLPRAQISNLSPLPLEEWAGYYVPQVCCFSLTPDTAGLPL